MNDHPHNTLPGTTTWITPKHIIEALGEFDLDPCTPNKMPWRTANERYTEIDNGLSKKWHGRVWLNPPYNRNEIPIWMERMAAHNNGIALVFARTDTEWFFKHVWQKATSVLFIEGRLYFHHEDGTRAKANSGAASVLIAYGVQNSNILVHSELPGHFIAL